MAIQSISTNKTYIIILFSFSILLYVIYVQFSLTYPSEFDYNNYIDGNTADTIHGNLNCYRKFKRYTSSPLEMKWIKNINEWQKKDNFCDIVGKQKIFIDEYLNKLQTTLMNEYFNYPFINNQSNNTEIKEYIDIFSSFEYDVTCDEPNRQFTYTYISWIEPLFAALRHPEALCTPHKRAEYQLVSKGYIVLDYIPLNVLNSYDNLYYLDIGASTYNTGAGGASQEWFISNYEKHRLIKFNKIILWECKPQNMTNVFDSVPINVLPFYQYYNIFADTNTSHAKSPLNLLKQMISFNDNRKRNDYISFKLDMDHPKEFNFIKQILNDSILMDQIDEMFFEHHVNFAPMIKFWKKAINVKHTLATSYTYFLKLRENGIRCHGWP
eukprot:182455_1